MLIKPNKLEIKDYFLCFKNAHFLMLKNIRVYIFSLALLLGFIAMVVANPILLAISPIIIVLALFMGLFVAMGCDKGKINLSLVIVETKKNKLYIIMSMVFVFVLFSISLVLTPQLMRIFINNWIDILNIDKEELKIVLIDTKEAIVILTGIVGFLVIGTRALQKNIIANKYDLTGDKVLKVNIDASQTNSPLIIIFEILFFFTSLIPTLQFWFLAPYSLLILSNYNYFINKAMFDSRTDIKKQKTINYSRV